MSEQKKPLLSIGMIVKDEIRSIERCLSALDPLRKAIDCELVIADTGSTDGTKEIAEKYADILFDFEWVDDFSAARNAVLDHCSGEWCLMVDADEYMDEDVRIIAAFLSDSRAEQFDVMRIIQRNYYSCEMRDGDHTDFQALRMSRIACGLRFRGTIHESLPITKKNTMGDIALVLHHDGYAQKTPQEIEIHRKRCERNLKLLEKKLEADKNDSLTYVQLIESTHSLQQRKKYCELAFGYFQRKKSKTLNYIEKALACRLISLWFSLKDERAVELLESMEPQLKSFFLYKCDIAFHASKFFEEKKDFVKALYYCRMYTRAIEQYDKGEYELNSFAISAASTVYKKERMIQKVLLVRCLFETGEYTQAQELLPLLPLEDILCADRFITHYMLMLNSMADKFSVSEQAVALFSGINAIENEQERQIAQHVVDNLLAQTLSNLNKNHTYGIFEDAPGEWGISVKLMQLQPNGEAEQATIVDELLRQVESWQRVSPRALYRVVECRLPFPDVFYAQGIGDLQKLTAFFSTQKDATQSFLCWEAADTTARNLIGVRFLFDYVNLLLQLEQNSAAEYNALCRLYVQTSIILKSQIYSDAFLSDETLWGALAAHQHFSLLFLKATDALQKKDELSFLRILNDALRISPSMKGFVAHVSDTKNHMAAFPSDEMLALASQVRNILAQFPADHPGVAQLKEGDAYKMVAPLLESDFSM